MRPAPLGGGRLFLRGVDTTRQCVSMRLDFHLFPLFCALFFPVRHCFCAGGFSLVVARPCIVIGALFLL
jgi:hypothetical protein